jgi:hypothetical protein
MLWNPQDCCKFQYIHIAAVVMGRPFLHFSGTDVELSCQWHLNFSDWADEILFWG